MNWISKTAPGGAGAAMLQIDETIMVIGAGAPTPLDDCHETLQTLFTYWEAKRGTREMPSRADIDPSELKPLLPLLCLIDLVPDARRYVYRLVGTRDVEMRGHNPTGKAVAEAYFATSAEAALLHYDAARDTRAPHYVADPFQAVDRFIGEEDLFLPLSNDGETVNMIMVFSISRDLFETDGRAR